MRIGFDAKRAYLNNTGLGNYSRFTINALCRMYRENEYFLYTPGTGDHHIYRPPENTIESLPVNLTGKLLRNYWRSFRLSNRAMKDGIELFHGLSSELPAGISKRNIKSVVTVHDLVFIRHPELYKPADRAIYGKKTRFAVNAADLIIAISKQTKNDLIELLDVPEEKIRIVYQGCNPWFSKPVPEKEKEQIQVSYSLPSEYLLYVGTIEERKNLLAIIRALYEYDIDMPLVAVGRKTSYFNQVQEYLQGRDEKKIIFLDNMKNQDLPALYQSAQMFIYPSRYEGFGIPVLEALNSGIPVITSQGTCLEETVGEGGLLVDPDDVGQLADSINKLLADKELYSRLVKNGKEHAGLFSEERTIPLLHKVYEECMK